MRSLFFRVWAVMMIGALALAPGAALAQQVSPGARSAIVNGAAAAAGFVSLSTADTTLVDVELPQVDEPEVDEPEVDEPEVIEEEVIEEEVIEEEVIEEEVIEEEVIEEEVIDEPEIEEPEIDEPEEVETEAAGGLIPVPAIPGDLVSYENAGITLSTPADWDVMAMDMFDNLFSMEVPGTDFIGLIQGGEALDFPGVLAVMIMRALPEFVVAQFGDGAVLVEAVSYVTVQDLPMVKIEFEADLEGMLMGGSFYVFSPGATAYIMIALAPVDQWAGIRDSVEVVAGSIQFDPELITLEGPADEPLFVVDAEETLEIVLPEFWLASATGDPDLPLLTVAPGYEYVAALTASRDVADDVAMFLEESLVDGEVNDDIVALVLELMGDSMAFEQEMMNIDPSLNEVFVVRDELVLRMAGSIAIDVGVEMPVLIYVGLRWDGISALIVFGDTDAALMDEDVLIDLLDSLLFIR